LALRQNFEAMCMHNNSGNEPKSTTRGKLYGREHFYLNYRWIRWSIMAPNLSLTAGLASLALFTLSASASSVANNTYEYIVVGTGPGGYDSTLFLNLLFR
jgi:hypothetical protein